MTTPADPLPSDLAGPSVAFPGLLRRLWSQGSFAHAMIVSLRGEALIRRLETEKLKFLIAKLRREQYGPSSERGKLLVEQLELAIADIEESQGAAEAEADIAAPEAAAAARESRAPRSPRPRLPENLPVQRVVYPVPPAPADQAACGLRPPRLQAVTLENAAFIGCYVNNYVRFLWKYSCQRGVA